MKPDAAGALRLIRQTVHAGRYRLLRHFMLQMDRRGLFWPDVVAIIDAPADVRHGGRDRFGRQKWLMSGVAADGLPIEFVCALDVDEVGDWTVFITMY